MKDSVIILRHFWLKHWQNYFEDSRCSFKILDYILNVQFRFSLKNCTHLKSGASEKNIAQFCFCFFVFCVFLLFINLKGTWIYSIFKCYILNVLQYLNLAFKVLNDLWHSIFTKFCFISHDFRNQEKNNFIFVRA